MKHSYSFVIALALAITMTACPSIISNISDRNGKFLEPVVNLEKFNSEFDDYNSALPMNKYGNDYLIFSSKRERKTQFNLVVKPIVLRYDDATDLLSADDYNAPNLDLYQYQKYYELLTNKANQSCNLLGPQMISFDGQVSNTSSNPRSFKYLLLFADDCGGDLQIKFVHNFNDKDVAEGPFEVSWLNSPKDDAYPTFNGDLSAVLFSSNRDGNFDIFSVSLTEDKSKLLETLLSKTPKVVVKNTVLSSPSDDKCPHWVRGWYDDMLYFVSNRPNGQGGFDIYYSKYANPVWSEPINMGSRINTAFDEYRPVVMTTYDFNYHLGIFSSNRPNGKGGFDLYMSGFLKLQ